MDTTEPRTLNPATRARLHARAARLLKTRKEAGLYVNRRIALKATQLAAIVGGLDRNGEDYAAVREAQHLARDLEKGLAA